MSSLLFRSSVQSMKFTVLTAFKHTALWHQIQSRHLRQLSLCRTFCTFLHWTSVPLKRCRPVPLPRPLAATCCLLSVTVTARGASHQWGHRLFVLLLPISLSGVSSGLLSVVALPGCPSFRMSHIPLYVYTAFYLSTHWLVDPWVAAVNSECCRERGCANVHSSPCFQFFGSQK